MRWTWNCPLIDIRRNSTTTGTEWGLSDLWGDEHLVPNLEWGCVNVKATFFGRTRAGFGTLSGVLSLFPTQSVKSICSKKLPFQGCDLRISSRTTHLLATHLLPKFAAVIFAAIRDPSFAVLLRISCVDCIISRTNIRCRPLNYSAPLQGAWLPYPRPNGGPQTFYQETTLCKV